MINLINLIKKKMYRNFIVKLNTCDIKQLVNLLKSK